MNNTHLLENIEEKCQDRAWLRAHNRALVRAIYEDLKRGGNHDRGTEALVLTFPRFVFSKNLRRWHKLNLKALKVAHKRNQIDPSTTDLRAMFIMPAQKLNSAVPKRPRSERIDLRELFETYVHLFMARFFAHPSQVTSLHMRQWLYLTGKVNIPYYYNKTYQTLALIYNYQGEYDRALNCLQMSHPFWQETGAVLEQALNAYATAMAYRGKQDHNRALAGLDRSAALFSQIDYPDQYVIVESAIAALLKDSPQAS